MAWAKGPGVLLASGAPHTPFVGFGLLSVGVSTSHVYMDATRRAHVVYLLVGYDGSILVYM